MAIDDDDGDKFKIDVGCWPGQGIVSKFVIVPTNGNVGISQATPDVTKLEVIGALGIGDTDVGTPLTQFQSIADPASGSNGGTLYIKTRNGSTGVADTRMTILHNGNVGIGTTTPQKPLHIVATGIDVSGNNQYGGMLSIMSNDAQAINTGGSLSFGGKYSDAGDYYTWAAIRGLKLNSTTGNADGSLAFYTRGNAQVTTERMRIDSAGNVGIGTTTPDTTLTVLGPKEELHREQAQ